MPSGGTSSTAGGMAEEQDGEGDGVEDLALRTRRGFLVGETGPLMGDALRKLRGELLHLGHSLAGAVPRRRNTEALRRGHTVVTLELGRAVRPDAMRERGEWHHLARAVAHIPVVEILGQHARGGIALDVHLLHSTAIDEVVDIGRAPRILDR